MKTLHFKISIQASPEKVWVALWDKENYQRWSSAFCAGSYYKAEHLSLGSKIHFLTPEGHGMFSIVDAVEEFKLMQFKHLGELQDFKELPINEETAAWTGALERY
ncbi:MAG: SRPBCC domain-containing protein, partial [Flavobacteriaceae bacterium]|nr:SRPBCC domain-containing protein [Flavobacteriaceae bacterium]